MSKKIEGGEEIAHAKICGGKRADTKACRVWCEKRCLTGVSEQGRKQSEVKSEGLWRPDEVGSIGHCENVGDPMEGSN